MFKSRFLLNGSTDFEKVGSHSVVKGDSSCSISCCASHKTFFGLLLIHEIGPTWTHRRLRITYAVNSKFISIFSKPTEADVISTFRSAANLINVSIMTSKFFVRLSPGGLELAPSTFTGRSSRKSISTGNDVTSVSISSRVRVQFFNSRYSFGKDSSRTLSIFCKPLGICAPWPRKWRSNWAFTHQINDRFRFSRKLLTLVASKFTRNGSSHLYRK